MNQTPDSTDTTSNDPSQRLNARILVVEDVEEARELVTALLEEAGAEVIQCEDGEAAIELIVESHHQGNTLDGIFMDMRMPRLDGYEATRTLRDLGFEMPIVAVTGDSQSADQQRCYEAGCTDYLAKPIDFATLLDIAYTWSSESLQSPKPPEPKKRKEPISQVVERLRKNFLASLDEQWPILEDAISSRDYDKVDHLVHWIKGTGGTLGLSDIAHRACQLQRSVRQTEEAAVALNELSERMSS